ncbi:GerAB/ArcD/ProY family transporter [Paenibacillus cremeus]|uniref:GerAB/ArcD/ProY family transporter n=1 Tax=Paenibacillus cremeus TaxID=2163881 RepID=A0A559K405_9BACL|nr:endospore germination permease [Paenibacillus cremeus]TVY06875.1 GerAB/ArcD/ProY family transporter [Paenibacillus cremeus]
MKSFEYGDQEVTTTELFILLPSFIHGVVILTIARILNEKVFPFGGVLAILLGGVLTGLAAWLAAKVASGFPGRSFFDYASLIVSKPAALVLTLTMAVHFLLITAFEVSAVGDITRLYLLPKTPMFVSALSFFLVIIYGVCGSRVGLVRLNLLFFPIYSLILVVTHLFVVENFDLANLKPIVITDTKGGFWSATGKGTLFFVGFEILLLYSQYVKQSSKIPKAAVKGMILTVVIALFSYVMVSGVMGHLAPVQLMFPAIEVMKEAQITSGIVERGDVLFFVIWMMTIFNTGAMAFDAMLLAVEPLFPRMNKKLAAMGMAPLIFLIAMLPKNTQDVFRIIQVDTYLQVPLAFAVPPLLLLVAKWRRLMHREVGG